MAHIHISKLAYVETPSLAVGDIVYCYGGFFRILTRREYDHEGPHGLAVNCKTEAVDVSECSIPKSWQKDWAIQGNALAITAKVIDPEILARFNECDDTPGDFDPQQKCGKAY